MAELMTQTQTQTQDIRTKYDGAISKVVIAIVALYDVIEPKDVHKVGGYIRSAITESTQRVRAERTSAYQARKKASTEKLEQRKIDALIKHEAAVKKLKAELGDD